MTTSVDSTCHSGKLMGSLAGGIVLGIPAGWLLAYLAALPAFLGIFFFLLFGLLIGAVMFRLGKPAAPVCRRTLSIIGTTVAVVVWATGLVAEYRWFPDDAAKQVVDNSVVLSLSSAEIAAYETSKRNEAHEKLRSQYPPGGFPGYLRWAAADGTMQFTRLGTDMPFQYKLLQRRVVWLIRLGLSLLALVFAIQSQFLGVLRKTVESAEVPAE